MTGDDLRATIKLQDKYGERMPILAFTFRADAHVAQHYILIDDLRVINGVEYLDIRDPFHGEAYSLCLDDFLEFWTGEATIPVGPINQLKKISSEQPG